MDISLMLRQALKYIEEGMLLEKEKEIFNMIPKSLEDIKQYKASFWSDWYEKPLPIESHCCRAMRTADTDLMSLPVSARLDELYKTFAEKMVIPFKNGYYNNWIGGGPCGKLDFDGVGHDRNYKFKVLDRDGNFVMETPVHDYITAKEVLRFVCDKDNMRFEVGAFSNKNYYNFLVKTFNDEDKQTYETISVTRYGDSLEISRERNSFTNNEEFPIFVEMDNVNYELKNNEMVKKFTSSSTALKDNNGKYIYDNVDFSKSYVPDEYLNKIKKPTGGRR